MKDRWMKSSGDKDHREVEMGFRKNYQDPIQLRTIDYSKHAKREDLVWGSEIQWYVQWTQNPFDQKKVVQKDRGTALGKKVFSERRTAHPDWASEKYAIEMKIELIKFRYTGNECSIQILKDILWQLLCYKGDWKQQG